MEPEAILERIYQGQIPENAFLASDGDGSIVYFISPIKGGPVKIGTTRKTARERLAQIQVGNHEELTVLGHIPGDAFVERRLHDIFYKDRLAGEWFTRTPELINFIDQCCVPPWEGAGSDAHVWQ